MNNINIPPVVKNLLIINGIFFLAKLVFANLDSLLGASYIFSPNFRIWQIVTYMFMHVDMAHIFFNMFALYMFGSVLENRWGAKKFINFYLITGLGALALQYAVQAFEVYQAVGTINPDLTAFSSYNITPQQYQALADVYRSNMVGASGAVFGLLVGFGVLYPNVELMLMFIPIPIKAKYFVAGYVVIELFLGVARFQGDSIAHFAHLGGALIGYILVRLWKKNDRFYDYYE